MTLRRLLLAVVLLVTACEAPGHKMGWESAKLCGPPRDLDVNAAGSGVGAHYQERLEVFCGPGEVTAHAVTEHETGPRKLRSDGDRTTWAPPGTRVEHEGLHGDRAALAKCKSDQAWDEDGKEDSFVMTYGFVNLNPGGAERTRRVHTCEELYKRAVR